MTKLTEIVKKLTMEELEVLIKEAEHKIEKLKSEKKVLIDIELLEKLIDSQRFLIRDYKQENCDRIHCWRWNIEVNEAIDVYNKVMIILGQEQMDLIKHD